MQRVKREPVRKDISLSDVISNQIFDDEWRDMTPQEREGALEKIKNILLATCRDGSEAAKAIQRMSVTNLPANMSTFDRLTVKGYSAGQSYPDEIKRIKEAIKRQC